MNFLTAEWRKLAFANYAVEPSLLVPYLPEGTELDQWNGTTYASLIGFMFLNTKLLGVPVPFHRNFEEVNLRFYVRRKVNGEWRRGVVFVKEIVPKPAITFVANQVYGEPYETHPMRHEWLERQGRVMVSYQWKMQENWQTFSLVADEASVRMDTGSEVEFITEHYWGYSRQGPGRTTEYEVAHPQWRHYPVSEHKIAVDFGRNYGPEFAFLNAASPKSVFLAEGSEIAVKGKRTLRLSPAPSTP